MPRKTRNQSLSSIMEFLYPVFQMAVIPVGIVIWAFNTFAQLTYVKEQNSQLMLLIDQRHKDNIEHSDMNRDRTLSILVEVKESIKSLENRVVLLSATKK